LGKLETKVSGAIEQEDRQFGGNFEHRGFTHQGENILKKNGGAPAGGIDIGPTTQNASTNS